MHIGTGLASGGLGSSAPAHQCLQFPLAESKAVQVEGSLGNFSLGITLRSLGRKAQAFREEGGCAKAQLRECRPGQSFGDS